MLTNLLLAFITGIGILLIFLALGSQQKPSGFERIERLSRGYSASEAAPESDDDFVRALRKRGLAAAIAQADLPVTPAGFLRVGLAIALLATLIAFLLSGALVVSLFVGALGFVLYVQWLFQRRDARRLEYEEALADLCDRLGVGAQLYGTLKGTVTHAAEMAPEAVKEDFSYIASQITGGASLRAAFEAVQRARASYSLDLLVDTLAVWQGRGATIPLHEILDPLSTTIRETAAERKRMFAELSLARNQMRLVAIAPLIFVGLLRFSSPAMARVYSSFLGQVVQMTAYAIALLGFVLGQRALSNVARVLEIEEA
jgi:Flp pilus assembly protein TadB